MRLDLFALITTALLPLVASSTGRAQSPEAGNEIYKEPSQAARPSNAARSSTRFTPAEIARALRKYAHEPSAAKVAALAVKYAQADPERAEQMASRARTAGWLPVVKLAVRRGLAQDLSEYQTIETDRTSLSTDDDLALEASLTFEFDRLVFDRNEVPISREERSLRETRAELVRGVINLYFERRRLQLERDLGLDWPIEREMRIAEIEALLNSFTNGAFGSMISNKR
ncbi:MAG: hypothetical protein JXA30_02945 [Deltaproteobacteria bacterium]|nr:hypothetical protein [Deltaproteobacteria bacterium]